MDLRQFAKATKNRGARMIFTVTSRGKPSFDCPICSYTGPFMDVHPKTGLRKHAKCPECGCLERHRIQFLVAQQVLAALPLGNLNMLHFAPEPFFQQYFQDRFGAYETADLLMPNMDHQVDIQHLPMPDASYDVVYASHVLEHIPDDRKAVAEIRRVLKPGGIAFLPVPIVGTETIEYPEPNRHEAYHVRAPGMDYYDRYEEWFQRVDRISSDVFPEKRQVYIIEDRSKWPTKHFPLRKPVAGDRHEDVIPVCYV